MGRRIGKPQTPTKAGYTDVFDIRQHQKYVKDNILANPKDDATGSVRFDGTDYFRRTPTTNGNRKTWTLSSWVKASTVASGTEYHTILSVHDGASRNNVYFTPSENKLYFEWYDNGTSSYPVDLASAARHRDVNSWYHIVISLDTTQAVSTDRVKIYVNGEQLTSFSPSTYPSQNDQLLVSKVSLDHRFGGHSTVTARNLTGYMSNYTLVNGLQLDPTYFGYTDRETGQWKPKRYTGDHGVNGFQLPISGDFKAGYFRADIADYDNTNLENNKAEIYSASAASFTSVWKAHEGKWGKSSWGNNHGKIELTADDAYNLKDVSATPWTIEGWSKFVEEDGQYVNWVDFGTSDYNAWAIWYNGNVDKFYVSADTTGAGPWDIDTGISLDPYDGEWHHWAFTRNTSGQYKLHYDGEYKGVITTNTSDLVTNNNTVKIFSHYSDSTQATADYQNPFVYHDSMRMIKGQDLYGTSDISGWSADIWNIASTKETYVGSGTDLTGTVSFLLPPNRYDAPFREISGKNNNIVIEGHRSYDGVEDSPQNTFATLNPFENGHPSATVVNEGNMRISSASDLSNLSIILATLGMPLNSGNWYFECFMENGTDNNAGFCGITNTRAYRFQSNDANSTNLNGNAVGTVSAGSDNTPDIYVNIDTGQGSGTGSNYVISGTISDTVWGFHFNADTSEVTVYRNGVQFDTGRVTIDTGLFFPVFSSRKDENILIPNFGQDHTFAGSRTTDANYKLGPFTDANGIGEFYYPPPDGAKALCTKNLEGGLGALTTTKKYYNRDETGKVLSYSGYNAYTYGTINDERFSDLSPYGGKSLHFDGVSEVINSPASSDHNIGTGAFTMEIWFKSTSDTNDTYYRRMFMLDGPTGNATGNIQLTLSNTGYVNGWTNTSDLDLQSATGFNDGKWHHAALVRSGTTVTLYIDGTSAATTTYGTAISPNSGSPRPRLGSYDGTQGDFDGYLADARLVVGTAVYTGNFTVPSAPLGTTQSSGTNIAAITGTATSFLAQPYNTETVNNAPPIYTRDETGKILVYETQKNPSGIFSSHFGPYADNSVKSFYFNGYNNLALKSNLTDLQPGTGAFTFECWLYLDDVSSNDYHTIFDNRDSSYSPSDADSFFLGLRGTVSPAGLLYFYTNGNNYLFGSSQIVTNNTWHHVALVRTSTGSGGLQIYLDGVGGTAETAAFDFTNTNNLETYLGTLCDSHAYNLYGYMSDIRFVKGTAVYTGNFTPPSGKLTTTGGTYPSTTNVNTSITAGHTTLLAQPYSQPAQIHDFGSTYRTNPTYVTDETGKTLKYG